MNTSVSFNWQVKGKMLLGTVLDGLDESYGRKISERLRIPLNRRVSTSLAAWLGQQTNTLLVFFARDCCPIPNTSAIAFISVFVFPVPAD